MDGARGWLSVAEAAAAAGVSRQTVYGWVRRGRLPVPRAEGTIRIGAVELARFLAARRAAARAGVRVETVRHWAAAATADGR